jgi:citrate lyase subunit gamma (acyl carrier protein)
MNIEKPAVAGTMESSDCMVMIRPGQGRINIDIDSNVKVIFGDSILATVEEILNEMDIDSLDMEIHDRGALDCVIRARVKCAICRAVGTSYDWGKDTYCRG